MRKRTLALLFAFTMAVGLLSAAALALDEPTSHDHTGWTAVTMGTNYIKLNGVEQESNTLMNGNYYLDGELIVPLTINTGTVNLCLNGHSVTVDRGDAVKVMSDTHLILCDCSAGSTGKIAYTGTSSDYGIDNSGNLTLNSGTVTGTYGVYNQSNSTFTMTGGTVTGAGSSGRGVYNSSSSSVFRLSGGSVSGGKYGIYNYSSNSTVYLSGAPSVSGATADIFMNSGPSKIYADDGGAENPVPYSGGAISLQYSSCSNGNTAVYHVTEDIKDKFTLTGSISNDYGLKFSAEDNALQFQGKPQTLTWYDINGDTLTGEGYPASIPYNTGFDSLDLPAAPAVEGKLFLGWLYKRADDSNWSTGYWSDGWIYSATAFKADYIDSFTDGGSGTVDAPYQIATAADLQKLATIIGKGSAAYNNSAVWYRLTDNIDLSTVCGEAMGNWMPIGYGEYRNYEFEANFDGNGKTISNLYINTSDSMQGLFGCLYGATVKNLTLTGSVTAGGDLGALAGVIEDSTVENVDVTGVILTPYGYTTDGNRVMAYKVDDDGSNTIHIQGNYKNNWIQTTYAREGYTVATTDNLKGAVTASADSINGGKYAQLSYTVTAGDTAITDGKLAVHADVQIGDNDGAAVEVIQDAAGQVIGLKMVDTHTVSEEDAENCVSRDAQFNLYFNGTGGVTPVDTYWFGFYGDRTNINSTYGRIYFAPLNDDTKSRNRTYEQVDGVYTKLTDTDSGFAVSWQNIDLEPGQSKTYSFILGVGEKADPPQWSDKNAVTLTLAADVEQNRRLVNVSAKVKDAAGLTDTLYYSVDGGEGVVLGDVVADGSMKDITGRFDLSGYAEGSYLFSFWVVNSKGAASASVERTITITADGIEGLGGDESGYNISGEVTDNSDNAVNGAEVKLMQGSTQIGETVTTDSSGSYKFSRVASGLYNVVATKDGVTKTILVEITNQNADNQNIKMPDGNKNSVVNVTGADTPAVVVGGVDQIAEAETVTVGETVTVMLTVEKKTEATADHAEAIKQEAKGKTVEFLELRLEKTVTGGANAGTTNITDTQGKVLEIVVPFDFSGKKDVTVYRYHGDKAEKLTQAQGGAKTGGTFKLGTNSVTIYATRFSTYAIGYTASGSSGGYVLATYPIYVPDNIPNGTVSASLKSAGKGTTITITAVPDKGYKIGELSVTVKDGEEITVTAKGNGKYTFTMPGGKATVNAAFVEITDCPRDDTCPLWPYTDVSLEIWYHDGIHYCIENGLMGGYGSGLFGPNDNLSRAQFAQILFNREGRPAVNYLMQYRDVEPGLWYTEAVRWAASEGVVSGYGDGYFGPGDHITREQLAVMLWRYAGSPSADDAELRFTDLDKASGYALDALRWAVEKGILNGYGNGQLDPQGYATRAQAAQMLKGFFA